MRYLVSVIDSRPNSGTEAERVAVDEFNDRLEANGHWVFAGGLGDPSTATVIDGRGAEAVFTDGPFVETKEALGGYYLIEADDLDQALAVAKEVPAPFGGVEVRPIMTFE